MQGAEVDVDGGGWIQTWSGKKMWPLDPHPEDICIEDIAHALSNLCRFNGHCSQFYSVAQHSVLVSLCCPDTELWGLLHDGAEAYIGDLPKPLKGEESVLGRAFVTAEEKIMRAVAARFDLSWPEPSIVKQADMWLLLAEARGLMGNPSWAQELHRRIYVEFATVALEGGTWEPPMAERQFLARYNQLTRE